MREGVVVPKDSRQQRALSALARASSCALQPPSFAPGWMWVCLARLFLRLSFFYLMFAFLLSFLLPSSRRILPPRLLAFLCYRLLCVWMRVQFNDCNLRQHNVLGWYVELYHRVPASVSPLLPHWYF